VPRGISKLAMERISSLSPAAREAALVAASLSRPTIATVSSAPPRGAEASPAIIEAADGALTRMRDLLDGIGIKDGLLDRTEPFHVESLISREA